MSVLLCSVESLIDRGLENATQGEHMAHKFKNLSQLVWEIVYQKNSSVHNQQQTISTAIPQFMVPPLLDGYFDCGTLGRNWGIKKGGLRFL
jgi:hypothetical protein